MELSIKYFQFKHPFTCMIAGPTSSGKTVFVRRLLENHRHLITGIDKAKIIWMYGQWQPLYNTNIPNVRVQYCEGLLNQEELIKEKPDLIVIDDLMTELGNDKLLANLFTKGSHHMNISVIFIVQNVFHQAKQMRTISLNCHYFVLIKNPRDKSQIIHLAGQLYPNNMKHLVEAFEDATSEPFGYIKADVTAQTPDKYRLQTRIFPVDGQLSPIVYAPK